MTFLVVNADDAGLAASSDAAILRCARDGIVRSATVVAGGPTDAAFVAAARAKGLDLGLHVNLTQGAAVAGPAPTLTDADGRFRGPKQAVWERAVRGELDAAEVRAEVRAQWDRLRDLGVAPTHVDGHNHVHLFPAVQAALAELASGLWFRRPRGTVKSLPPVLDEWAAAVRGPWRCTERFTGHAFCDEPTEACFLRCLEGGGATIEFMVHPGARPGSPFGESPHREREADVLCSETLRAELARRGVRVGAFREAPCA